VSSFSKSGPPDQTSGIGQEATEYQGNDPLVGQVVGKYKIVERIARGGTATVYKAMDQVLKREVAFKILHQHLESRPDVVERFRVEAQTVASLRHPNILNVYDFFNHEGRSILVAEFMPGYTLSHLIKKFRRIPEEYVLMIGAEILQGLREAHARGFTHRDIKPANILMHSDLGVKISDFGLAKLVNSDDGLTKDGVFVGTPSFSSPEQIEGKKVDHRTDLFSLGLTLYIMATGHHAFKQKGDSTTTVWFKIVRGEFQGIREFDKNLTTDFERVLEKSLQVDPSKRYASADEMLQEMVRLLRKRGQTPYQDLLKRFLDTPFGQSKAAEGKKSRKKLVKVAAVFVVLIAVFGLGFLAWELSQSGSKEEVLVDSPPVIEKEEGGLSEPQIAEDSSPSIPAEPKPIRPQATQKARPVAAAPGVGAKTSDFVPVYSSAELIYEQGDKSFNWRFQWKNQAENFQLRDEEKNQDLVSQVFSDGIFDWNSWDSGTFEWKAGAETGKIQIQNFGDYRAAHPVTKRDLPVSSQFGEVDLQINPWIQQIRLTWESGPGADSYRVEIAEDQDFRQIIFAGVVPQRYVQVDRLWDKPTSLFWRVQYLDGNRNVFFIDPIRKINLQIKASSGHTDILEPRAYQQVGGQVSVRALAPSQTQIKCGDHSRPLESWTVLKNRLGFLEAEVPLATSRLVCQAVRGPQSQVFVIPLRSL
jgi:serine/threonine-protein kinase